MKSAANERSLRVEARMSVMIAVKGFADRQHVISARACEIREKQSEIRRHITRLELEHREFDDELRDLHFASVNLERDEKNYIGDEADANKLDRERAPIQLGLAHS
jgi:hypothetical protein